MSDQIDVNVLASAMLDEQARREAAVAQRDLRRTGLEAAVGQAFPALRTTYDMAVTEDGQAAVFRHQAGEMRLSQVRNGWLLRLSSLAGREYVIASELQLVTTLERIQAERESGVPRSTTAPAAEARPSQEPARPRFISEHDVPWPE